MTTGDKTAMAIFAGLILLAGYMMRQSALQSRADVASLAATKNKHPVGWVYTVEKDEMRGTSTNRATLRAEDEFFSPSLILWREADGGKGVMLSGDLEDPVGIRCDLRAGTIAVRADGGKIENLRCNDGMSVAVEPKLYDLVEQSKILMVEVGAGYGGVRQYTFKTAGLKLEQPNAYRRQK